MMDAETPDLELLASAHQEAVEAHRAGLIVGPAVDEVALRRAARRAWRADAARRLTSDRDGVA